MILQFDRWLFEVLNQWWTNPLLDRVMPFITEADHWKIAVALGVIGLAWLGGSKGRWTAGMMMVGVLVSDRLVSHTLKHWLARPRPFEVLAHVRLLSGASGYAFPSGHATNAFMAATVLALRSPRLRWGLWGLATLVGWSRVYVGVHYPFDVVGGAVCGAASALIVVWLMQRWERRDHRRSQVERAVQA